MLDDGQGLWVIPNASAQADQTLVELRFDVGELSGRVRLRGVDDGPRRQDHDHGLQGSVRVELRAAMHTGRVVRDHTADRADALTSRVGAKLPAVPGQ